MLHFIVKKVERNNTSIENTGKALHLDRLKIIALTIYFNSLPETKSKCRCTIGSAEIFRKHIKIADMIDFLSLHLLNNLEGFKRVSVLNPRRLLMFII